MNDVYQLKEPNNVHNYMDIFMTFLAFDGSNFCSCKLMKTIINVNSGDAYSIFV